MGTMSVQTVIREVETVSRNVGKVFWFAVVFALALAVASPAAAQFYKQVNLVSDISGMATVPDPLLVNPWGVSFTPTSPFWVSDAGSNMATLYAVDGTSGAITKVPLNVS